MRILLIVMLTIAYVSVFGQQDSIAINILRQYDQNFVNSETKNFPYLLKEIPIANKKSTISFGGSYRFQGEHYVNQHFSNSNSPAKLWLLHRPMVHTHLKVNSNFEAFLELNSSLVQNKENLSPVDKDELSINQFFLGYSINDHWNASIGRKNMRLGSGRLIDIREGPNVRLSFDLVEINYEQEKTKVKAFYSIPVQQKPGVFDNDALNTKETLSAFYWTQTINKNNSYDLYLLHKYEKNKEWNAGTENDSRYSLGLRTFGELENFNYNNEFVYQFGSFGDAKISAWTASLNVEKELNIAHPITLGLKTEAISGDKTMNDGKLNTFDGLYPRGAYFGRVAYFGPSNLIDIHPYILSSIGKLAIELDYVAFWRFSEEDGIYNTPLILTYKADPQQQFVAHQIGGLISYPFNSFINAELETNTIFPSDFLNEIGNDDPLTHFVVTLEFKF